MYHYIMQLIRIRKTLETLPSGSLSKRIRKNGHTEWYLVCYKHNGRDQKYIRHKDVAKTQAQIAERKKLHEAQKAIWAEFYPKYKKVARQALHLMTHFDQAHGPHNEPRLFYTLHGDAVASKSELIISMLLVVCKISYAYEKPFLLHSGSYIYPDFTLYINNSVYYWEHLGMLNQQEYARNWQSKKALYEEHNIIEGKNLIVSRDEPDGSINIVKIACTLYEMGIVNLFSYFQTPPPAKSSDQVDPFEYYLSLMK